jgi:hypothetical protein
MSSGREWLSRAEALAIVKMELITVDDASELLEEAGDRREVRRRNEFASSTGKTDIFDGGLHYHGTWVDSLNDEFHEGDLRKYLHKLTRRGKGRGGRPEFDEWEGYEKELRAKIKRDGLPRKKTDDKSWRVKADAGRLLANMFVRDGKEPADISTCQDHADKVMKEFGGN